MKIKQFNHLNLPDECLLKIFSRLVGPQERSNSMCVSKRWLLLLSHIRASEILRKPGLNESDSGYEYDNCEFLERSLVVEASDIGLAAIAVGTAGHGGLGELLGSVRPMHNLKSLSMASCRGVTNLGLEVIANGSPNLKQLCLRACFNLSDDRLEAFVNASRALEILEREECNKITLKRAPASLLSSNVKLHTLALIKCSEIKDIGAVLSCPNHLCMSLQSLTIRDCPGFTSGALDFIDKICPRGKRCVAQNTKN